MSTSLVIDGRTDERTDICGDKGTECFDVFGVDLQELSYCRGWPTVREQLKRLCLHRRCVEYLATGNFYLLA